MLDKFKCAGFPLPPAGVLSFSFFFLGPAPRFFKIPTTKTRQSRNEGMKGLIAFKKIDGLAEILSLNDVTEKRIYDRNYRFLDT